MVSSTVEMHDQYGSDLVVIGMNALEEPAAVRSFTAEQGMTYLNLIADKANLRDYQVRGHPFTVLITPDGQISHNHMGYTTRQELDDGIRALMGLE